MAPRVILHSAADWHAWKDQLRSFLSQNQSVRFLQFDDAKTDPWTEEPTLADDATTVQIARFQAKISVWNVHTVKYQQIMTYIRQTISPTLAKKEEFLDIESPTQLYRKLKKRLEPDPSLYHTIFTKNYVRHLQSFKDSDPILWAETFQEFVTTGKLQSFTAYHRMFNDLLDTVGDKYPNFAASHSEDRYRVIPATEYDSIVSTAANVFTNFVYQFRAEGEDMPVRRLVCSERKAIFARTNKTDQPL